MNQIKTNKMYHKKNPQDYFIVLLVLISKEKAKTRIIVLTKNLQKEKAVQTNHKKKC